MEELEKQNKAVITGADYKRLIINAAEIIKNNEQEINDLNVFPVPDGDTGSNMSMTIGSAADELRELDDGDLGETASKAASSMLRGARGNSGVILSLMFRGMSKAMANLSECDGKQWAKALREGVKSAYQAVEKPVEGTILTVARKCAEKAEAVADQDNSLEKVHEAAVTEAEDALRETVNQNPVLQKAGVVDAGAKGWLLVMKSMLASLRGKDVAPAQNSEKTAAATEKKAARFEDFNTADITFPYCTECIINRKTDKSVQSLRALLSAMGDSLVLVDDEKLIKIHVHTADPLMALAYAKAYGDFINVKIENMRVQHSTKMPKLKEQEAAAGISDVDAAENEAHEAEAVEEYSKQFGIVSVCSGDGMAGIFTELGCDAIVSGGQTMNPSTDDIVKAVESIRAEVVFVFPNNKNIILAAEQAKKLTSCQIEVIPSTSVPQGIMAMVQFDPELSAEENVNVMTAVLSTVDTMEVTFAARDSVFDGMTINKGDIIGMYSHKIVCVHHDIEPVLEALAKKAVENGKYYLNLYYGDQISEEEAAAAAEIFNAKVSEKSGSVDVTYGGQPLYHYMISAE